MLNQGYLLVLFIYVQLPVWIFILVLRGYYTPNSKVPCFVLCLKTVNTFLKNNIAHDQMTNQGHLDQISLYCVDGGHPCISNVNTAFQTKL